MTSLKLTLFLFFTCTIFPALCLAASQSSGCDGAGNCYVRGGAAGSGSGADWTNAYTGFGTGKGQVNPASMTRGVTYYVAAGTYAYSTGLVFSTPDSGSSVITIQAATTATHGTSTGWSNAYQGQAVFTGSSKVTGSALIDFESDYWVFNGAYNDCGTYQSEPFPPCRSGYGFQVNNNNGSNQPWFNGPAVTIAALAGSENPGSPPINNVTISFTEIAGDADTTGTYCNQGLHVYSVISGAQSTNDQLVYSYIHDTSNGPAYFSGTTGTLVDHNWFLRDWTTPNCHSEVGFSPAGSTGTNNATVSNNYFENLQGTAHLATPSAGTGGAINGFYIYGNVFFCNSAEATMGAGKVPNCPGGDGYIFLFNGPISNVYIYNNDFDAPFSGGKQSVDFADGVATTFSNVYVQNNIFSNSYGQSASQVGLFGCPGNTGGATCNDFTYGYLSYMNAPLSSNDSSGTSQQSSTNPYTNAGTNTSGANDYSLAANSMVWVPLGSPYNVDPAGITRISSRGSFQYGSNAPPSPPTGLSAAVE